MTITTTGTGSLFGRYDLWNSAIEAEFFDGGWRGRPVYIDMEDEVVQRLGELAGAEGDPREAFARAVKPTLYLPGERDGSLLDLHVRRLRRWRYARDASAPPCLAILAFFVLAAEGMRGDEHFRSNNYYARLTQLLGIDPVRSSTKKDKIANDFRRDSLSLWNCLNSWLADHDGALGTPTAYAFDWRSYAGVPISQALLREEERLELRKMFLAFRLQPGQELATSDMLRLLKEWLPRADVSFSLKQLFEKGDAQARIADIACVELQAWDGTPPPGVVPVVDPSTSLLLVAQVRRLPRNQLTLSLTVRGTSPVPEGIYELDPHASAGAAAALASADGAIHIGAPSTDGWRAVSAEGAIDFPDLLIAGIRLCGPGGAEVSRKPRRLIILERDEGYRLCVEAERVQLARDTTILAHQTLAEDVDGVLEECAREGWQRWSPDELRGLPEDWIAWTDVEIMSIPDVEAKPDLSPLVPLEWTKIVIDGGISLPGYATWLADALPEVRVTTVVDKPMTLTLIQTMSLSSDALNPQELASFEGAVVVPLAGLLDGDYRVSIRESIKNGAPLVSTAFRVRSADYPRINADLHGTLAHVPDGESATFALSADRVSQITSPFVAGAAVDPEHSLTDYDHDVPSSLRPAEPFDPESETEAEDTQTVASSVAPSCLMGGAHSYVLPEASRDVMLRRQRPGKIDARCSLCGFEKWFPPHTRAAKAFRNPTKRVVVEAAGRIVDSRDSGGRHHVAAISVGDHAQLDTLLLALSYARGGGWPLYERLAGQFGEEPWFAADTARALSALGHLDLHFNLSAGRPMEWVVAGPTLIRADEGAVLCGARSAALLSRLEQDATALGGHIEVSENDGGPATILVRSVDSADLVDLAESLASVTGSDVRVNLAGAAAIAAELPSLQDVARALPTYTWPAVSLERFNIEQNKWLPVGALDGPGAYKFMTRPLRYGLVRRDGAVLAADNRLVKWLAAHEAGRPLMAYDEDERILTTRLGAQLPGLYERAAVLCSGRVPTRHVDGTVSYAKVSPEIASALYDRLCAGPR